MVNPKTSLQNGSGAPDLRGYFFGVRGVLVVECKGRHKARITLTPDMLEHLGIRGGDRVLITPRIDGSIIVKAAEQRSEKVDERS